MPTGTNQATEGPSGGWNPFSEAIGKAKAAGKLPGYGKDKIPLVEAQLPEHIRRQAELHELLREYIHQQREALWFSTPQTHYIPITLDPQVENIIRLEGRIYSGIYVQSSQTIIAQPPGLGQVSMNVTSGWNPLNLPEGSRIYAQTNRSPAWLVISNEPVAGAPASDVAVNNFPATQTIAGSVGLNPNVGVNIGQVSINNGGNSQNSSATSFWNAAVVGAGGTSAAISIPGYGKVRVFVSTSVADTFNVQISDDGGTTWYTLTQDNAGTPLIIATTATQLNSCRDILTFGGTNIRLLAVGAATITAGHQAETT